MSYFRNTESPACGSCQKPENLPCPSLPTFLVTKSYHSALQTSKWCLKSISSSPSLQPPTSSPKRPSSLLTVSNPVLAPSSPLCQSSQSDPMLCLSCSDPFRRVSLPAAPALSPASCWPRRPGLLSAAQKGR